MLPENSYKLGSYPILACWKPKNPCLTVCTRRYILIGMKSPQATREQLLQAAFDVIYRKGFKAASLTDILKETPLTKGALYHHFPNKKALGLSLLDSVEAAIERFWLKPLAICFDPLDCLQTTLTSAIDQLSDNELVLGCPLNNLAQEMSALDEDFRLRVDAIYTRWQRGIEKALRRGQQQNLVSKEADAKAAAVFYVAALAGGRGLAKTTRSADWLQLCASSTGWYLESLRPALSSRAGDWMKDKISGLRRRED